MKTLDEIMISKQTDKASVFTRTYAKPKNYGVHYEKHFAPLREKCISLLEIGVGGGESIRSWLEYFTRASVYGVDNNQSTNPWNTVGHHEDERYTFVYGDQSDPVLWKCFAVDYGDNWDIIIDDGAHMNDATITAFNGLWPLLNSGGFYCVEDLGTAYGGNTLFVKDGWPNQIDWLRRMVDEMNQGRGEVASIYLSPELAILRKA